jgi:hypothetical protein
LEYAITDLAHLKNDRLPPCVSPTNDRPESSSLSSRRCGSRLQLADHALPQPWTCRLTLKFPSGQARNAEIAAVHGRSVGTIKACTVSSKNWVNCARWAAFNIVSYRCEATAKLTILTIADFAAEFTQVKGL